MSRLLHPLFALLASATRQELARQVQFLKVENEILRAKLPKQITVTPPERRRLLKAGLRLGAAVKGLVTIVTPGTFLQWARADETPRRKPPDPPLPP